MILAPNTAACLVIRHDVFSWYFDVLIIEENTDKAFASVRVKLTKFSVSELVRLYLEKLLFNSFTAVMGCDNEDQLLSSLYL